MTFKIPQADKKFSQPNTSDLEGNIFYSRNVSFDENGYVRLSNRAVTIGSEEDDSNLDIPIAFGRKTAGAWNVVSPDEPLDMTISETALSVVLDSDSGTPDGTFNAGGRWWQNRWYATGPTGVFYKVGTAWTDPGLALTAGVPHPLEVFRNRNTLCAGNGNVVKQYTTAHAASVDLTIPSGFEVVGMAHSGNKMGIITRISSTEAGQNQEAYFFVWDGASTSAGTGYPIGADSIYAITAYKGSWMLLSRTGELLFWNGGGFERKAALPFYFRRRMYWGTAYDRQIYGDALQVEGDLIYINVNAQLAPFGKSEEYLYNCPTGVLCYDPNVGLYHRYSPSVSRASLVLVTSANINATLNKFTKTGGTLPATGNPMKYVSSITTPIAGLEVGTVYYIIKHTATEFSLALTKQDALDGNKIDVTGTGASNNYFLAIDVVDFGATRAKRTGCVSLVGIGNYVADHLVFGGEYYDTDSFTEYGTICMTVQGFENRGYIVSPRITSNEVDDDWQNVFIKYRKLKAGEKIIVKQKVKDVFGLPITTPQDALHCAWTSDTVFTTMADLGDVKTYVDADGECEVEVISGAGAGVLAQIESITENAGTYTVTLAEAVEGAGSGKKCDILIDSWEKKGEITSDDVDGFKAIPLGDSWKSQQLKIEMRGVEVTIEEIAGTSETRTPLNP